MRHVECMKRALRSMPPNLGFHKTGGVGGRGGLEVWGGGSTAPFRGSIERMPFVVIDASVLVSVVFWASKFAERHIP